IGTRASRNLPFARSTSEEMPDTRRRTQTLNCPYSSAIKIRGDSRFSFKPAFSPVLCSRSGLLVEMSHVYALERNGNEADDDQRNRDHRPEYEREPFRVPGGQAEQYQRAGRDPLERSEITWRLRNDTAQPE